MHTLTLSLRRFSRHLAFSLLCCSPALAQTSAPEPGQKTVYLHSVLGVSAPGLSALNTELTKAGFLALPEQYLVRGAGFTTLFPRIRLATLFNFSSYSTTRTEQGRSSWTRASTAGTSLGLIVRNREQFQLIPYAGLVFSWFGARLSDVAPASNTFAGYLVGPTNQIHVARNQFMGNLGLHVARPSLGSSPLARKLFVGARVGYFVPLTQPDWQTNGVSLSGGPRPNTQGAYLHLLLGSAL
ncbi:hypothetical protein F5984_01520 [Rudanella paleaurantiibacter]|uniref:Outer membrane beta-barrel protein n=1 Tax=Rudanella paleaurantiibacter TaxID=2614655 RepID=A0A7J5U4Z1_9BACT|nr:hypothetical protein [Rudanella paleaurantiibacter]KAB7732657.1 hypothetical protein F5984_01520 [Rudanella paleaurantiibacter]